jgi:RimJ/RimL family protein N-acetyltransferase
MFPEITRDDVFRLETRRLWLCWPARADAEALAVMSSHQASAEMTTHVPHPYPKEAAAMRIDAWRATNAAGLGLHLLVTRHGSDRRPVGTIGLDRTAAGGLCLSFLIAPDRSGEGLGTEAAQGLVDAAFILAPVARIEATARVINPAARRVLERCGFAYEGTGLEDAPARGGMVSADRFRLERKTWASLKQWRMPRLTPAAVLASEAAQSGQPPPRLG